MFELSKTFALKSNKLIVSVIYEVDANLKKGIIKYSMMA